jgi:hypothetical protein
MSRIKKSPEMDFKTNNHSIQAFNKIRQADIVSRKFTLVQYVGALSTSGSGTLAGNVNMDPSSSSDWSTLISNYYDEFRVVAVRAYLTSSQQFSITSKNCPIVVFMDNDSSASIGYTTAIQYANKSLIPAIFAHSDGKVWRRVFKRPETQDSPILWSDVATPSGSLGSLQIVSPVAGLTASTEYFQLQLEYLIEARGRR